MYFIFILPYKCIFSYTFYLSFVFFMGLRPVGGTICPYLHIKKKKKFIDLCRQYMNNSLEQELNDEIRFFESTEEADDQKTLEYHYDLVETVKTFNDYLCIIFLNLANILTYPNETFYEKYTKNQIRITPDDGIKMANKICKRMQEEFEDVIREIFPIRETVARISKVVKDTDDIFETKEVIPSIKKSKGKIPKEKKERE